MIISVISFTKKGIQLSQKMKEEIKGFDEAVILRQIEVNLFTKCTQYVTDEGISNVLPVEEKIGEWAKEQMEKRNALLFIGACGIAVRAIAPYITDKLHDSPVLVMDERGKYVIPILAGHMGGANELAFLIGKKTGAEPVITTATDINGKFSVDLFAKRNGLFIANKEGIAKVSAKVLSEKEITISVEPGHGGEECKMPEGIRRISYPPSQAVDIVITSEKKNFDASLLLRPKEYVIGMGCKRGKEADKIEAVIIQSMKKLGIAAAQIAALASVNIKSDEPGLLAWSKKENMPFVTYTAEELQRVKGNFHKSDFVREKVGVDNVCERAALKAAGPNGKLVYEKHAGDGMTIAIAKKEWRVEFGEA